LRSRRAPSARLCDLLAELVAERRRVLVFSQVVEMLELVAEDLRDAGVGFETLTGRTRDRSDVLARFGGVSGILGVELANHLLGHGVELGDPGAPPVALFGRSNRVMGDDQAMAGEAILGHTVLTEGEAAERLCQFAIAAGGHGEDELKRSAALRLLRQGR